MSSRFIVGIDLGTTHCALAYVDTHDEAAGVRVLDVPQLVAQGLVEPRGLLPSFLYYAHSSEGAEVLPWDAARTFAVGEHARGRGADAPTRVISSAKSWLCHPSIDRRGPHLPASAPDDIEKISPVEASFRYLEHLAEAWDYVVARGDASLALSAQDVILTVPASFDAAARELTVEAALAAGLDHVTLLEEPQAALYAWIAGRGDAWRKELRVGDVIVVIDVGGGTTDFSAMSAIEKDGSLELTRIAVGDHILLGGDNMDLTLAHRVRMKLEAQGKTLDGWQMSGLVHGCRAAKERLLARDAPESVPIAIASRGSKLLGGSIRTDLTRAEVIEVLVDGFFPSVESSARPAVRARVGLRELGLPYASDAGVTRHLAAFLGKQASAVATGDVANVANASMLTPTAILFNGGVMKADALRIRIEETLGSWLGAAGSPPARVLDGADLDLAVAKGAACYGLARRGTGIRIRGGTARAYYVGIESATPAVPGMDPPILAMCLAPFGMEEGTESNLPNVDFGIVVGEPVHFRFFGSTTRRDDSAGTMLERFTSDELEELSQIEVVLKADGRYAGDVVPVYLRARVTEVGTLELDAVPTAALKPNEHWRIELSVRAT